MNKGKFTKNDSRISKLKRMKCCIKFWWPLYRSKLSLFLPMTIIKTTHW